MAFYLFTIGFVSILGQVAILRELNVAFYGVELVYIIAIGLWMLWTAAGALIGRRAYVPKPSGVLYLFLLFGLLLPADVALIRAIRIVFEETPGSYLPFVQQLIAIGGVLLPLGILLGLLFQWAAKLFVGRKRTLAIAYAIESAGGLMGGLVSTALMMMGIQNFAITLLCGLITVAILPFQDTSGIARRAGILLSIYVIALLVFSSEIDRHMTGWNHPAILDTEDSPYGRITITGQSGQVVLFENDTVSFETETTSAEELAHLAVIQRENVKRVLVLGGGFAGLVLEILKHDPERIDYVELNRILLDRILEYLPEDHLQAMKSGKVTVHIADPRKFLADAGTYDLIIIGMPEPASGQANRFFTKDFFAACSRHLERDGVLAFGLLSSENLWTPFLTYRNASIFHALRSAFRDAVILPGTTNILIASGDPLSREPAELGERLLARQIAARLVSPRYVNYLYTNDRFREVNETVGSTRAPVNSDQRPVCFQFSSMNWLMKFYPEMVDWDLLSFTDPRGNRIHYFAYVAAVLGVLFYALRRWAGIRRTALAAIAGFVGMIMEANLILYYQTKNGVLFQNIGILLMMFMAGLALGSCLLFEIAKISVRLHGIIRKRIGTALLLGFVVTNLVFVGLLRSDHQSGVLLIALLMFLTGFLVAGTFAYASLVEVRDQTTVISPLYSADLIGGCFGSLLASLILIPFLGMDFSAVLVIAAVLAASLLL